MKRWSLIALLCACGPAPAPSPSVVGPTPAVAGAERVAIRGPKVLPRCEVIGEEKRNVRCFDEERQLRFELRLRATAEAVVVAPGGDAVVLVNHGYTVSEGRGITPASVVRFDVRGKKRWAYDGLEDPKFLGLTMVDDHAVLFRASDNEVTVIDPEGTLAGEFSTPLTDVAGYGDVAVVVREHGIERIDRTGKTLWSKWVGRMPSLRMGSHEGTRKVGVGTDGTVLTGAADGSMIALDRDGNPLFQVGVPGEVQGIETRADGWFAVRSDAPNITLVRSDGSVRLAEEPVPNPFPRAPVDDGVHVERMTVGGVPLVGVESVEAHAPDDVWVLAKKPVKIPGKKALPAKLYHYDGARWSLEAAPDVEFASEVFAAGAPAASGRFVPLRLGRTPKGKLAAVGTRVHGETARMCMLEYDGQGWQERRDLARVVATIKSPSRGTMHAHLVSYITSEGGRELLCQGGRQGFRATFACVIREADGAVRILGDDEPQRAEAYDDVPGADGGLPPLVFVGETLRRLHGFAFRDGGETRVLAANYNGLAWLEGGAPEELPSPLVSVQSMWASRANDLWITSERGVAHFDGSRFARIFQLEGLPTMWEAVSEHVDVKVTGSRRGDAWLYGPEGLWRASRNPDRPLAARRAPAPPAATRSIPLPVEGNAPFRLEPVTITIPGEPSLRGAVSVAGGGGVTWFHDGVRVVELERGKARTLFREPDPEPFVCWSVSVPDCGACAGCTERRPYPLSCHRCVAPYGAGVGSLISQDGWVPVRKGAAGAARLFAAHTGVAAAGPHDAWVTSIAVESHVPTAFLHTDSGISLVGELPSFAYSDVVVSGADDVWLAGSLSNDDTTTRLWPAGEGALVHYDGQSLRHHRGPHGALLSVGATGAHQAWSAGLDGGVVRVADGQAEVMHLTRAGKRLRVAIRSVAAAGPKEVWLAGDDGLLLVFDGDHLRAVDTHALSPTVGFAQVAVTLEGRWLVGPTGIWKIEPSGS
ncbi:MAG: hypothetical protein AAF715_17355 [Myxococcota bacterium]